MYRNAKVATKILNSNVSLPSFRVKHTDKDGVVRRQYISDAGDAGGHTRLYNNFTALLVECLLVESYFVKIIVDYVYNLDL